MHVCSRCEKRSGDGELLDEQFLCNECLAVILVDAQNEQTWTNEDIQRVFRYLQDSRELWKAGYTEADELMTEEANKAIESFQKISDWLN